MPDRTSAPTERGAIERIPRRRRSAARKQVLRRRATGFVVAAGLCLLLALEGGGYDAGVRHQVGVVIWTALALGLAFGVLPRSRPSPAGWTALGGFAALAVVVALAHGWSDSAERTTAELARVLQYLGIVALGYLALNRETWQGAAAGFAAAALLVVAVAVASRLFPEVFRDEVAETFANQRLSYPLDYWNAIACWGAMVIAIALLWAAHAERVAIRSVALAAVPVAGLAVYLSYSRAGVGAVVLAVVAAIVLGAHRWTAFANLLVAAAATGLVILVARGQDEIAEGSGAAGGAAVLVVLAVAALGCAVAAMVTEQRGWDRLRLTREQSRRGLIAAAACVAVGLIALQGPIGQAWDEFRHETTVAASEDPSSRLGSLGGSRYPIWRTAVQAFESDPGRGVGPGTFEFFWNRQGGSVEFTRDAHSLYLEQLAELGLPGLLIVLVALGGLLAAAVAARRGWTRGRDVAAGGAMLATFVVFLFYAAVDWMWEMGAIGTLALGGAAVAGAGGFSRGRPREWGLGPRLAAIALALLAVGAQVPGLVSLDRVQASDSLLSARELSRARELATEAIDAQPWAASPFAMRALVAEAAGDLAAARDDLGEAIEREPLNWRYHLLLARIEARAGDREAVEAQLAEVAQLWPGAPFLSESSPYRYGLEALLTGSGPAPARPPGAP